MCNRFTHDTAVNSTAGQMVRARPQWVFHALICTPAVRSAWGFSFSQCISRAVDLTTYTRWRCTTRCFPEHHEQETDQRTLPDSSLSRKQLLQVFSSAALAIFSSVSLPYPSGAALPTPEDYSFGTGSKVTIWRVTEISSMWS